MVQRECVVTSSFGVPYEELWHLYGEYPLASPLELQHLLKTEETLSASESLLKTIKKVADVQAESVAWAVNQKTRDFHWAFPTAEDLIDAFTALVNLGSGLTPGLRISTAEPAKGRTN